MPVTLARLTGVWRVGAALGTRLTCRMVRIMIDNVSTRIYNDGMTRAIVTKSGNSYALRVPKRYIEDNHLRLGDEVEIDEPVAKQGEALAALVELGRIK